jgi:hypothetical protein
LRMCGKLTWPTAEESQAFADDVRLSIERITTARQAIMAHAGGKRGVTGKFSCPVCKTGALRYAIAACNGHIQAGCSTSGCVRWME